MKKLIAITLALVLVLTLGTGLALVKGPAEKATGTVGLGEPVVGWYADFNAHEEMDGRPDKGSMRQWNDLTGKDYYFDVKYVQVDGDEAWFAALCTSYSPGGAKKGWWLFVKVYDGGSPGSEGDEIGWVWKGVVEPEDVENEFLSWVLADPVNCWDVIDGNLVVHTY